MYPQLKRLHDYYFTCRDPRDEGLVCIVHPWESGLDNSPIWVGPLKAAQVANSLRFSGIIYEIKKKHVLEHRDVKIKSGKQTVIIREFRYLREKGAADL